MLASIPVFNSLKLKNWLSSKEALKVIYDESVSKRDQVSGVSLDQEAADLVRYQQAYQASAKVMQTAGILFDAIVAIR